jgi:hypothetical protein
VTRSRYVVDVFERRDRRRPGVGVAGVLALALTVVVLPWVAGAGGAVAREAFAEGPPAKRAAAQDAGVEFVVEPVPGSQTAPRGGYFVIAAEPASSIGQAVGLRNDSERPLELHLAAVDAVTGSLGGVSYGLPDEEPVRTGAWISLADSVVQLAPGASAAVPFEVSVPADARSGVHLAGLSVAVPGSDDDPGQAGSGQAGASIDVRTRRVVAVQIELPGPSEPELVIGGVTPAARPDGLYLEVAIENAGHGLTTGEGTLTLPDEGFERRFSIDTFVPATAIAYPVRWTTEAEDGTHRVRVEVHFGDRTATWEGTFGIGDDLRRDQADRQVETAGRSGGAGRDLWVPLVAGAVVVVLAVAGLIGRRVRRPRGRHAVRRSP